MSRCKQECWNTIELEWWNTGILEWWRDELVGAEFLAERLVENGFPGQKVFMPVIHYSNTPVFYDPVNPVKKLVFWADRPMAADGFFPWLDR